MEWVHCNKCYQKINKSLQFFMKECGRIECQKCLQPTGDNESKCVACNKSCRTIVLGNDMKPEVRMFFKPLPQLLDNVKKVYEFQMRNHHNLWSQLIHKYTQAKSEVVKSYKQIDTCKKDIEKLKVLLKSGQLSTPTSRYFTSTPVQQTSSPSLFNGTLSTLTCTPKTPYARPGHPIRITSADRSCSTVSSREHVVPGFKQSLVVPTHRNRQQTSLDSPMTQKMQNLLQGKTRYR